MTSSLLPLPLGRLLSESCWPALMFWDADLFVEHNQPFFKTYCTGVHYHSVTFLFFCCRCCSSWTVRLQVADVACFCHLLSSIMVVTYVKRLIWIDELYLAATQTQADTGGLVIP
jgi:hypothetical protein